MTPFELLHPRKGLLKKGIECESCVKICADLELDNYQVLIEYICAVRIILHFVRLSYGHRHTSSQKKPLDFRHQTGDYPFSYHKHVKIFLSVSR